MLSFLSNKNDGANQFNSVTSEIRSPLSLSSLALFPYIFAGGLALPVFYQSYLSQCVPYVAPEYHESVAEVCRDGPVKRDLVKRLFMLWSLLFGSNLLSRTVWNVSIAPGGDSNRILLSRHFQNCSTQTEMKCQATFL